MTEQTKPLVSGETTERPGAPPDVSIVMPCLDEAKTLGACIDRANEALRILADRHGLRGEIVVADNGSADGSQAIARDKGARVINVAERGYGAALRGGIEAARGRYVVMGDCDCSYDFVESVPMVEHLMNGNDICMGSRFRGEIKTGAMPFKNRYFGNPVLSGILRLLFRAPVSDAHCGIRALTKGCFRRLRLESNGMEFASEMVLKAALLDCRYSEVPVTLWPDKRGRAPHLRPWRDGWRHLRYMLMLSPLWLFFGPCLVFGILALAIFLPLLLRPEGSMTEIAGLPFGDHWMPIAAAFIVIAFQTALFGLAATIHGIREGYRRVTPVTRRLLRLARLEYLLLTSGALVLVGGTLLGGVILDWATAGFGALSALRDVAAAATLGVLGCQAFFGGFMLSIIAGNRARPDELLRL